MTIKQTAQNLLSLLQDNDPQFVPKDILQAEEALKGAIDATQDNATQTEWQEIPDDTVRAIWLCDDPEGEDCKVEVEIAPYWYAGNGTPVCCGCDRDMVYDRTEVRQAKR